MTPARLAVYAVSTYDWLADPRYVMAWVDPPAHTYSLSVPPGEYQVVARLDSDPVSSAGHLVCQSISCGPTMTRAGFVTCHTADCQPVLVNVSVASGQSVGGVDIGGWGSLNALGLLWTVDEFGAPGPITYSPPTARVTPSPSPQLPFRELPPPASDALFAEYGLPVEPGVYNVAPHLHLPVSWQEIANPAQAVNLDWTADFSNEHVRSPLGLDDGGVWLSVRTHYSSCWGTANVDVTAKATLVTDRGAGTFVFEDPHSPLGAQPYRGYAFEGTVPWGYEASGCLEFRFTTSSEQTLAANLPTFVEIVRRAG